MEEDRHVSDDDLIFAEHAWSSRGGRRLLVYDSWPIPRASFSREGIRRILKQYGAWGAIWSYDWDCGEEGPWYWIVCDDREYDLENFRSRNTRKLIRRGLNRTNVRRVEPEWLAENGFACYRQALTRYTDHNVWDEQRFKKYVLGLGERSDVEMYGAFVEDELVAYAILAVMGQTAVWRVGKFDPAHSSACPMYALFYTLTVDYLRERGLEQITGGARPLLHGTEIGEFSDRMGWRKAYCRLGMYCTWRLALLLWAARAFRGLLKRLLSGHRFARLEAMLLARDIAGQTSRS